MQPLSKLNKTISDVLTQLWEGVLAIEAREMTDELRKTTRMSIAYGYFAPGKIANHGVIHCDEDEDEDEWLLKARQTLLENNSDFAMLCIRQKAATEYRNITSNTSSLTKPQTITMLVLLVKGYGVFRFYVNTTDEFLREYDSIKGIPGAISIFDKEDRSDMIVGELYEVLFGKDTPSVRDKDDLYSIDWESIYNDRALSKRTKYREKEITSFLNEILGEKNG